MQNTGYVPQVKGTDNAPDPRNYILEELQPATAQQLFIDSSLVLS